FYVKHFLIENPDREENFIGDNPKSYLELVSTDYLPVAEVIFYKERGKDQRPNDLVDLDEFIAVKGIKALGNQLTSLKVRQINLMDPKPFVTPEETAPEDMLVVDEDTLPADEEANSTTDPDLTQGKLNKPPQKGDNSQIKLFDE